MGGNFRERFIPFPSRMSPRVMRDDGEGGLAPAEVPSETRKSKFAKRTWNVPWNQRLHFLGVSLHRCGLGVRGERVAQDSPLKSCRLFQVFERPQMPQVRNAGL